ncbi:uncharacterized protein B0I36DRAFT_346486 [Microdochium trichocladiopsis]|uniref:Uncharacterized protein n=1 Tax=Microdochium trichocladiopsis TaxID=1682393 RepID=A0A9P8YAA0_9PEZI|nr:uncharacterized protein B0I36DRAFT_346486 [Microdochium trichocladiopsis]KAH7034567.1 hypothetical protein B0I36DRAFT_346486 [Microdochium trichocladiopsis]
MSRVLRMLRSRRNVFTLGRQVNGGAAEPVADPSVVRIQHVRFKRKVFRPWNVAGAGLMVFFCYHIYKGAIWGPLDKFLDDELASMSAEERRELAGVDKNGRKVKNTEDILSIPLPFTTRMVKQPPYAGNSPEWKAFVKLSKDNELRAKIENDVCNVVQRLLQNSTFLTNRLGKEMRVSRKMLTFNYPNRPPSVFMRKNIVVDDATISITEKPVHPWVQTRIMQALWPSALAVSLWTFSGALVKQNMDSAARLLGIEQSGLSSSNVSLAVEQVDRKLKEIASSKTFSSPNFPPTPGSKPEGTANGGLPSNTSSASREKSTEPTTASVDRPLPSDPSALSDKMLSAKDLYLIKVTQEHTSGPWQKFKQSLGLHWKPKQTCLPQPGSIAITGLVSFEAPHAYITCEVKIWYNAVSKAYEMRSSTVRVKEIQPKRQVPLMK